VSIALVLFLMATVGYVVWTLSEATESVKERMTLFVTVAEGTTEGDILNLGDRLLKTEGVREVVYISKEEAAEDYREYAGGDWQEFLDYNPLPDTFQVRLVASESTKSLVESLEEKIGSWSEVDDIVYQRGAVESMEKNLATFRIVLLIFGALLLFVAVVLLRNTIRMSVYSRREIISTMKLVGATRWFIIKPFLRRGALQGFVAALVAILLFVGSLFALDYNMPQLGIMNQIESVAYVAAAMLVAGVVVVTLFTLFAVNRFVNMKSKDIYLY
jgi:cell division transport system permease protein